MMEELKEGIDYTINGDGLFVFTRKHHLKRGYCCESNCLNCPYGYRVVRRDANRDSNLKDEHVPEE